MSLFVGCFSVTPACIPPNCWGANARLLAVEVGSRKTNESSLPVCETVVAAPGINGHGLLIVAI